jgi:hypothetical protein
MTDNDYDLYRGADLADHLGAALKVAKRVAQAEAGAAASAEGGRDRLVSKLLIEAPELCFDDKLGSLQTGVPMMVHDGDHQMYPDYGQRLIIVIPAEGDTSLLRYETETDWFLGSNGWVLDDAVHLALEGRLLVRDPEAAQKIDRALRDLQQFVEHVSMKVRIHNDEIRSLVASAISQHQHAVDGVRDLFASIGIPYTED